MGRSRNSQPEQLAAGPGATVRPAIIAGPSKRGNFDEDDEKKS
jgi:hypothetical protein